MNYFSIDYLIIYAFLLISLIIGLWTGRGIKDIREYALANRTFGTGALVLSYLATNIAGASVIQGIAYMFSQGIIVVLALAGLIIAYLTRAFFIVPKVAYFKDCLTMGDLMEVLYDTRIKVIAGVLGTLTAISLAGMELILLGFIIENLIGVKAAWAIMIGGLLLAAYTSYGGIKSVTTTDVFQFLVMIIVLPIIAYIVLHEAGGIQQVFTQVPTDRWKVFNHPNFSLYLSLFLMWSIFPVGMIDPAIIQRLLMAKNGRQLRDQYLIIAAFDPAFQLVLLLISFSALVLYPTLEAQQVIPHIIKVVLPVGMKGLAIASLLAVSISSIDSYLHAAGLTFTHDVIKPLAGKRYTFNELPYTRYITLALSLVAIVVALRTTNTFGLLLNSLAFTGPLLMFPLFSGIMGLKTDKQSFYVALVVTLAAFMLSTLLLPPSQAHLATLIAVAANGFTFFGTHLIKNKGFATIQRDLKADKIWKPNRKAIFDSVKAILPTPKHIVQYSRHKVAQYSAPYIFFSVFFTINYIAPYFLWAITPLKHNNLVIMLRLVGGILCGLLIVEEKWPKFLRPYLPTFWHLTILYCLPFTSTIMFLVTQGSSEWLVNMGIITILLFILVDWVTGLIVGSLGIILALVIYRTFIGEIHLSLDFSSTYLLIYQGIFGLLIGLIFARRKEQTFNALLLQNQHLTASQQTTRKELASTLTYREHLLQELKPNEASLFDDMTTAYIQQVIYRMADYMRLEITSVSLDTLQKSISDLYKSPVIDKAQLVFKKVTQQTTLQADLNQLKQLLLNAIYYIEKHNTSDNPITITIEDAVLGHDVAHMPNHTRELAALKITLTTADTVPPTQPLYKIEPAQSTWVPKAEQDEQESLLIENARILDAHYGYMQVASSHTQVYVLPIKLREIRGSVMELIREPAGADPAELKHPLAIQLEQELLQKLKGTKVDKAAIQKALELIKKYHSGVKRKSGEPFFTHPITVALIVLEYSQDQEAILGALLHDTVEDTSLSLQDIERHFGKTVAFLVGKATNLEDHRRRISMPDKENITRILNYEDPRAALVKLADRLHNMRTIQHHTSLAKKQAISQETLDKFVPLAKKLGLTKMATELEQLSLAVLK